MARTNREQEQTKSYNGADSEAKGYPKTRERSFQEQDIQAVGRKFMRNEKLVGVTSLVVGAVLLLNFFGLFTFFNYIVAAIGVALLVYGGYKLDLARRTKNAVNWFQDYLEENKKNQNNTH